MSRCPSVLAIWLMAFAVLDAAPSPPEPRTTAKERQQGYRDSRILAKPRASRRHEASNNESRLGARQRQVFERLGDIRVLDLDTPNSEAVIQQLRATGDYEFVEPDYLRKRQALPDDPKFVAGDQWYLRNTGQASGTAGADIAAVAAWDTRTDASSVIVAVIDTGIRVTHEDLAPNLWINPGEIAGNGLDDDANGYVDDVHGIDSLAAAGTPASGNPDDDSGHGTAIAGVIAAAGNNTKGITGIAWKAKIMALKFDDREGSASVSNEIECIDYALAKGARIINISYGSFGYSQSEYEALKRARDAGAIVIASAGNDELLNDLIATYPANYLLDNLVAVAATDRLDALSSFSNYGSGLVELAAPGTAIISTASTANDAYETHDGTSFSAPLVAGVLALLKAQLPNENYRGLINRVLRSVDPLPTLNGRVQTGGRLDAARAITTASNRPFNDDFSARAVLTGSSVAMRSHTAFSTVEPGEPAHAGAISSGTLWWSWTAPSAGDIAVETLGSSVDTVLAVYTGAELASLVPVVANDDAPGTTSSRASFVAAAGSTYHIALASKSVESGAVLLRVAYLPTNDAFASAIALEANGPRVLGFNNGTGSESSEPTADPTAKNRTVWYSWTAGASLFHSVSVFAYGFDAVVGVYTGTSVSTLTPVATGSVFSSNESANFEAVIGRTYWIQIDSADNSAGVFEITVSPAIGLAGYFPVDSSIASHAESGTFVSPNNYGMLTFFRRSSGYSFGELEGMLDVQTPAIGPDGSMFIGDENGYLYAYAPDFSRRWRKDLGLARVKSSPALGADGTIYVHADDGYLYGYFPDGTLKWKSPVPGESYSSPAIGADGTIYLGADDAHLYAISPLDGAVKWKFKADGAIYSSPALDDFGYIYFGTLNGKFYSITSSNVLRWMRDIGHSISSSPALGQDGTVYFGAYDGNLHALSAAGAPLWSYATDGEIRGSSPAVASNGSIYIGSYDGSVHAVSSSGVRQRLYPTGAYIRSSPLIDQGIVYFGSGDSRIYAGVVVVDPANSPWPMHRQNARRTGRRAVSTAPSIVNAPTARSVAAGASTTLGVNAVGADTLSFQWYLNGQPIAGATRSTYVIESSSSVHAGAYTVAITNSRGTVTTTPAVLGLQSTSKVIGTGSEVGANIVHANKNIFDQVLLSGAAATVTADPGQILRLSFVDAQQDIVQVEFSGAGALSIVLATPTGPAEPVNYNQAVQYMRGHAGIVVTGANETTYLSVFTVGRQTAVNQALFKDTVTYDGFADIAFVAIQSNNGTCGGMRSGNTRFSSSVGFTGLYAPGVHFQDRIFMHDIDASGTATPMFVIGSAVETRITGGDLTQSNSRAVQVQGLTQLQFTAGTDSHGNLFAAQNNKARLERDGLDVTAQIVANPPP